MSTPTPTTPTPFESAYGFLTASFQFAPSILGFSMAVQGAVKARHSLASSKTPFTAFKALALTSFFSFGGAWFAPLLIGQPSKMLASETNAPIILAATYLVFYSPLDLFYKLISTLPLQILYTAFAQLFRASGVISFVALGNSLFNPSPYYDVPIIGPILLATLLGNMGGIFLRGWEAHLSNGMPWPFQNGLVMASFFQFYSYDTTGIVGTTLRSYLSIAFGPDGAVKADFMADPNFARVIIAAFMVVVGVLQLPELLGPSFNPFAPINRLCEILGGFEARNTMIIEAAKKEAADAKKAGTKKKKKVVKED